jgi:hypothetical protein
VSGDSKPMITKLANWWINHQEDKEYEKWDRQQEVEMTKFYASYIKKRGYLFRYYYKGYHADALPGNTRDDFNFSVYCPDDMFDEFMNLIRKHIYDNMFTWGYDIDNKYEIYLGENKH